MKLNKQKTQYSLDSAATGIWLNDVVESMVFFIKFRTCVDERWTMMHDGCRNVKWSNQKEHKWFAC